MKEGSQGRKSRKEVKEESAGRKEGSKEGRMTEGRTQRIASLP